MYRHPRFVPESTMGCEPMVGELRLTDYLVEHPAVSMIHKMQGPSMRDAGILDGDDLIVEKWRRPIEGDIVLAIVDEVFVIREFASHEGRPYLRAANPSYGSIMPDEALVVLGTVTGVVRKYH